MAKCGAVCCGYIKFISIVYLAVNDVSIAKETLLSIQSFFTVSSEEELMQTQLVVYTNFLDMYAHIVQKYQNIVVETVSAHQLEEWIAPHKYIYKAKIHVLIHCIQKYKTTVLFVDGDTIFIKSPAEAIAAICDKNTVILHYIEDTLAYKTSRIELRASAERMHPHVKKNINQALYFHQTVLKEKLIDDGKDIYIY